MNISDQLELHGKKGFEPDSPRIPYLFYPKHTNSDIFQDIYISLVRVNDFSHNSINSNAVFKDLIRIENIDKGFTKDWKTGSIFDPENPIREMSDEEEWEYLSEFSESYEKDFLENYVYSDDDFVDLYGRAVALILLYFSTINNLKSLILILESFFMRDKRNFQCLRDLNQIQVRYKESKEQSKQSEISILLSKLESLINLYNKSLSKKEFKFISIEDKVHDLKKLSVQVRDIRNKFSHGQWDDMKKNLKDISLTQAFKVTKKLYEAIEESCNWHDIEFIIL